MCNIFRYIYIYIRTIYIIIYIYMYIYNINIVLIYIYIYVYIYIYKVFKPETPESHKIPLGLLMAAHDICCIEGEKPREDETEELSSL